VPLKDIVFCGTPTCASMMTMKPRDRSPVSTGGQPRKPHSSSASTLDPERWVEQHCDNLFRYALARVASPETAEDLVQETLLAAWRSAERFAGRASERTWLVRILRNKIMDHYRRRRPEFAVDNLHELAKLEEQQFVQSGWHAGSWTASGSPADWKNTEHLMDRPEFWKIVHQCSNKLPPTTANVFLMREVEGQTTEEICSTLKINRNHLGVLLHRARLVLRRCLELHWFREPT